MRGDFVQMRSGRVLHVVGTYADLSNTVFAGTDSKVNLSAEDRRRWFLPQVRRMGGGQFLRFQRTTVFDLSPRLPRPRFIETGIE